MKRIMFFTLLITAMISCSSNSLTTQAEIKREALKEMVQEDKVIGDDLPNWIYQNGIENGRLYTVGIAEFSADKSPIYVQKAAMMDAEVKLLSGAPADFRVLTQNAITGAGIDSGNFYQIQTKLQKVIGLKGIRYNAEKQTCRKMLRYGELSTRVTRICYSQAYILIKELIEAYRRTLAYKYGEGKALKFKDIINDELNRINNNPILKKTEEKHENNKSSYNINFDDFDNETKQLYAAQLFTRRTYRFQ